MGGTFEQAKGKIKEAAGDLAGNPDLRQEGAAQDAKGSEQREATEARAKAQAHEKKAEAHEQKQESAES